MYDLQYAKRIIECLQKREVLKQENFVISRRIFELSCLFSKQKPDHAVPSAPPKFLAHKKARCLSDIDPENFNSYADLILSTLGRFATDSRSQEVDFVDPFPAHYHRFRAAEFQAYSSIYTPSGPPSSILRSTFGHSSFNTTLLRTSAPATAPESSTVPTTETAEYPLALALRSASGKNHVLYRPRQFWGEIKTKEGASFRGRARLGRGGRIIFDRFDPSSYSSSSSSEEDDEIPQDSRFLSLFRKSEQEEEVDEDEDSEDDSELEYDSDQMSDLDSTLIPTLSNPLSSSSSEAAHAPSFNTAMERPSSEKLMARVRSETALVSDQSEKGPSYHNSISQLPVVMADEEPPSSPEPIFSSSCYPNGKAANFLSGEFLPSSFFSAPSKSPPSSSCASSSSSLSAVGPSEVVIHSVSSSIASLINTHSSLFLSSSPSFNRPFPDIDSST